VLKRLCTIVLKRVSRLGEEPEASACTETLQALHGLACRCGFKNSDLDFRLPECPHSVNNAKEHIGFECDLPPELESNVVLEEAVDDEEEETSELEGPDSFLLEVDFAEEDTRIDPDQFPGGDDTNAEANDVQCHPLDDALAMDENVDVDVFLPEIPQPESTHESVCRLTKNAPWTPFEEPNKGPSDEVDKVKHALFGALSPNCDRTGTRLDSAKGCKTFAKAWDLELASLCTRKLEGEAVTLTNRKSCLQLQQHFDNLVRHKESLALAAARDEGDIHMEEELRAT